MNDLEFLKGCGIAPDSPDAELACRLRKLWAAGSLRLSEDEITAEMQLGKLAPQWFPPEDLNPDSHEEKVLAWEICLGEYYDTLYSSNPQPDWTIGELVRKVTEAASKKSDVRQKTQVMARTYHYAVLRAYSVISHDRIPLFAHRLCVELAYLDVVVVSSLHRVACDSMAAWLQKNGEETVRVFPYNPPVCLLPGSALKWTLDWDASCILRLELKGRTFNRKNCEWAYSLTLKEPEVKP